MTLRTLRTSTRSSRGIDSTTRTTTVSVDSRAAETFSTELLGAMSPTTTTSILTPFTSRLLQQSSPVDEMDFRTTVVSVTAESAELSREAVSASLAREEELVTLLGSSESDSGGSSSRISAEPRSESDIPASGSDEGRELGEALSGSEGETVSLFITSADSPTDGGVGEISMGATLAPTEKPKILMTLSTKLNANRIPTEIVFFIKRIDVTRFADTAYTILRKDIFTEDEFVPIATILSNRFRIDPLYTNIANKLFTKDQQRKIFTFVDNSLNMNRSYAYKIKVDFDILSQDEQTLRLLAERAGPRFVWSG